jgi:hypothetical protein
MSSAAPSRAGTRQEQRPAEAAVVEAVAGEQEWLPRQHSRPAVSAPASAHVTLGSRLPHQQQQQQQQRAGASGQLMELLSEDDAEEASVVEQGLEQRSPSHMHLHPAASWEQPRPTPELMQHLREARALLQPSGTSYWGRG